MVFYKIDVDVNQILPDQIVNPVVFKENVIFLCAKEKDLKLECMIWCSRSLCLLAQEMRLHQRTKEKLITICFVTKSSKFEGYKYVKIAETVLEFHTFAD